MTSNLKYFYAPIIAMVLAISVFAVFDSVAAAFTVFLLVVLEISVSFDNAVVNAAKMKTMDEVWKHRFLTWGMLIAVFGMRLLFPIILVCIIQSMNPVAAFQLAIDDPHQYSEILHSAHIPLAGFGGAFLLMVFLKFFIDSEKDVHWFHIPEHFLTRIGKHDTFVIVIGLGIVMSMKSVIGADFYSEFLPAAIFGIIVHECVDGIKHIMQESDNEVGAAGVATVVKGGFATFMYLEVLDASFSFDGVIAALAITNNIFVIMAGLGVGAYFVRSLTIMLDQKGTLSELKYLEHSAMYCIGILSLIMFAGTVVEIPEIFTGLIGVVVIGAGYLHSMYINKKLSLSSI